MSTNIRPALALAVAVSSNVPAIGDEQRPVNNTDSEKAGSCVDAVEAAVKAAGRRVSERRRDPLRRYHRHGCGGRSSTLAMAVSSSELCRKLGDGVKKAA